MPQEAPFLVARFTTPGPLTPRLIEVVGRPWYTSGRLPDDLRDPWSIEYDVTENGLPRKAGFASEWAAVDYISEAYPGSSEYPV
jgi:hypothetical protein